LKQLVEENKFREDLYYRLNVFPIKLPPLRERIKDVPELALHFLQKYCTENKRPVPTFEAASLETLTTYHWPGNVRELEHVIERLVILVEGDQIQPVHVSAALFRTDLSFGSVLPRNSQELKQLKKQIRESSVQEIEKLFIEEALARNGWNVSRAAREVNMQRPNFQALMKKYGIRKPTPGA
jgi:DNA-binding NtrC family response regulator